VSEISAEAARRGRGVGLALVAVAALTLAVNASWIARHLDWLRPLEAGQTAPPFDLPVIGEGGKPTGARMTSEALRGKVVVVEFWATWCGPCLTSLPKLDRAARGWGDRVATLAVNLDDEVKAAEIFGKAGWRMTLVASDEETATRYQVEALPHAVVIDRAGTVRLVMRGAGAARAVEEAVGRLLAEP
jgi:thiol-disulfide isomerase/thioredoxin